MGQNIGTCVTALLSSISGDKNAKRAHLEFNTIGAIAGSIVATIYFVMFPMIRFAQIDSTSLALFHSGFNIGVTILLFPFAQQLVSLSKILVPDTKKEEGKKKEETLLDFRFLPIPEAALSAVNMELERIGRLCLAMIEQSKVILIDHQENPLFMENNQKVFEGCEQVRAYLEKINPALLTPTLQQQVLKDLLKARDLLQISISCKQLAQLSPSEISLQESSLVEINTLSSLCEAILKEALKEISLHPSEKEVIKLAQAVYNLIETI